MQRQIAAFTNEPFTEFSKPEIRSAMEAALGRVRSQFGREYELWMLNVGQRRIRKEPQDDRLAGHEEVVKEYTAKQAELLTVLKRLA